MCQTPSFDIVCKNYFFFLKKIPWKGKMGASKTLASDLMQYIVC